MKSTLIIFGLAAAAVVGFLIHASTAEAALWRKLSLRVPTQALSPTEAQIKNDGVSSKLTPERDEIGHVQLGNGDIWRFAFRSHHLLGGPDSFSVFSGPPGTFRVRGDYFCCEVQFPGTPIPKDSSEFLAFLRSVHKSVEPAR